MNKLNLIAFGLLFGIAGCGSRSVQGDGTDSNTHWLSACTESVDCGSGLSCVCGSCTKPCGSDSTCESLDAENGLCVDTVCGGSHGAGSCSLACNDDDDCPQSLTCSVGACLLRLACEPGTSCSLDTCEGGDCDQSSVPDGGGDESNSSTTTGTSEVTTSTESQTMSSGTEGETTTSTDTTTETTTDPASTGNETSTTGETDLCPAMNAQSSADACFSYGGAIWNGSSCRLITCGCVGEDCDQRYATVEQCENQRAACTDTVPTCSEFGFPLRDLDPGFALEHPTYRFGAVAEAMDSDGGVAPFDAGVPVSFDDWTPAVWGGWLSLPTVPEACPGIRGNDEATCPFASRLHLIANGEDVYIDVDYLWDGFEEYYAPTEVEFRIDERRELEVREAGTLEPVLFVGQNNSTQVESWEFSRLHVRVGSPVCQAQNEMCNWLQTTSELLVGIEVFDGFRTDPFALGISSETALGLYETQIMEARLSETETARYEVGHSASFSGWSAAFGDEACGAEGPPRIDGFFIHRLLDASE